MPRDCRKPLTLSKNKGSPVSVVDASRSPGLGLRQKQRPEKRKGLIKTTVV